MSAGADDSMQDRAMSGGCPPPRRSEWASSAWSRAAPDPSSAGTDDSPWDRAASTRGRLFPTALGRVSSTQSRAAPNLTCAKLRDDWARERQVHYRPQARLQSNQTADSSVLIAPAERARPSQDWRTPGEDGATRERDAHQSAVLPTVRAGRLVITDLAGLDAKDASRSSSDDSSDE
eukprot:CAMPEP_0180075082 /NCGR_PEP_ID=MMETSP0985-20121206/14297_1 /TAXON_ID=483367 /ORGANISM="non described non described, Strain CCMP 2436" /LENGTH=176 /DNA_ID=CAMNT_0022006971 /DNA_START=700 /DNA_END=1232 /DNA_ORIENTATION=+